MKKKRDRQNLKSLQVVPMSNRTLRNHSNDEDSDVGVVRRKRSWRRRPRWRAVALVLSPPPISSRPRYNLK